MKVSGKHSPGKGRNRTSGIIMGVLAGLVLIVAVVYLADVMLSKDRIPRGTTVGGVNISNMTDAEARSTLERELNTVYTEPVTVIADEAITQFDPAASGLGIDWEATAAGVPEQSWNPITRLTSLFVETEAPIESIVDPVLFGPTLDRIVGELYREPVIGNVAIDAGNVVSNPSIDGQSIDRTVLETEITNYWLDPEGVEVEPEVVPAAISQDRIDELVDGPAAQAVSAPFVVRGDNDIEGVIPVERMGEIVSFPQVDGDIQVEINREIAQEILAEPLAETEFEPANAKISFASGSRVVTPEVTGHEIDWDATLEDLEEGLVGDGEREVDAVYEDTPATFTEADAQAATFDEVVGEFTTSGFSAASGTNIRLTAQMVDGAVVSPGDTFSLNGYTGPRGSAQGFVDSGIIINGRSGTAVGGGISQFATTLYNAYYFAGLEDITHTPHSYYISRYPAGREATIFDGAIDLQFRNNSPFPVMIDTVMGSDSITVKILGVDTTSVQSINNGRWATTQPNTVRVSGSDCIPSTGAPGFTTSDTRIISDLAGNEITRETVTTVYDPSPNVICS
ncbi:VanW family protein [uncultured Corynebacterium sp.]|uniref:VanW family protein n=1 Tax=uncultured Corynebacterium sp. TaxID=159447 RepID=UPI0025CFBBA4|nr:VanW family protein [uncultured Corynebacterium sp.]